MTGIQSVRPGGLLGLLLLVTPLLGGCGIGYYWQASMGHLELMRQRRPVVDVMDDPRTGEDVRAKLRVAMHALDFAYAELGLPDNGSYRLYADIGRSHVLWNVVAAPEFSLEPRTWCFPIAGCVSYRGYFSEADARRFAAGLAARGDDVYVGGVAAYSTLGRFRDPILSTMIAYADYRLAGLIFHELAHQRVYVADDSTFNESFASFVEQEGLRRWLEALEAGEALCHDRLARQRGREVQALLADFRERLAALYASGLDADETRAAKAEIFPKLAEAYGDLRSGWSEPPHFDAWFEGPLNNARLVALATYDAYVPAFAVLLDEAGGKLDDFYARVEALAALRAPERSARLSGLLERRLPLPGALPPGCAPPSS
ncbi:MAG: aminopeptidase [Gammaproteobacteria bacterium]